VFGDGEKEDGFNAMTEPDLPLPFLKPLTLAAAQAFAAR